MAHAEGVAADGIAAADWRDGCGALWSGDPGIGAGESRAAVEAGVEPIGMGAAGTEIATQGGSGKAGGGGAFAVGNDDDSGLDSGTTTDGDQDAFGAPALLAGAGRWPT